VSTEFWNPYKALGTSEDWRIVQPSPLTSAETWDHRMLIHDRDEGAPMKMKWEMETKYG
jgi:hypothetical protein